jgi:small subunit ribosomal protein S4
MARYTGPKNRLARRFGANVFGKTRNPSAHKQNPPGQHGAKKKKKSDYGVQLEEQQKLRACFGMITRKQLVRYYKEAVIQAENTQEAFLQRLETRLDTLVYRLKFALSPFHAQQLVAHGHILVDGKKVDVRSFQVKPGMTISIHEKAKSNGLVKQALERAAVTVPEYLSLDAPKMSGQLVILPHADQIPLPLVVNVAVVCEFLAYTT